MPVPMGGIYSCNQAVVGSAARTLIVCHGPTVKRTDNSKARFAQGVTPSQINSLFARRSSATAANPIAHAASGTNASAGTPLTSHAAPLAIAMTTAPP